MLQLEGLHFRCFDAGEGWPNYNPGGAVQVTGGVATFTDVKFSKCGNYNRDGGAVNLEGTDGTFTGTGPGLCKFEGCKADVGGGVRVMGGSISVSNCDFDNNMVRRHSSQYYGAAIFFQSQFGDVAITGSRFQDNTAGVTSSSVAKVWGAVVYVSSSNSIVVTESLFKQNVGGITGGGGALYAAARDGILVDACTFDGNAAGTNSNAIGAWCRGRRCAATRRRASPSLG